MLRIVSLLVLVCLVPVLGGCQTLVASKEQQIRKFSRMSELNRLMFNEDIQNLLMLDRSSNLSPWYRTWH